MNQHFVLKTFRHNRFLKILLRIMAVVYISLIFFALFNFRERVQTVYPSFMFQDTHVFCQIKEKLGPVKLNMFSSESLTNIKSRHKQVLPGGQWTPECHPWQKLAIIIPYRDRYHHLLQLLDRLHAMLKKQLMHYRVYVIEQSGESKFNRGRLLNIGVVESLKDENFDCFVFHDVDLLPEDDRNIYYCNDNVHHPISALDEMRYHVMYYNYLGGVLTINKDNVFKANGHSNDYWGWGNEDDDFNARTNEIGLLLTRPPEDIGRFKMAKHEKLWRDGQGNELFLTWKSRWRTDGLNQLDDSKYRVVSRTVDHLYTNISVDLGPSPSIVTPSPEAPRETYVWFLKYYFP